MSDYEQCIYLFPYLFNFQVLSLDINLYLNNDDHLRITEVSASAYISLKETAPLFEVSVGFLVLKPRPEVIIVTYGCVSSP